LALLCLLPATYPEQSNYFSNQQQVFGFAVPFTSLHKLLQKCWAKTILLSKPVCFDFSSSDFNLQGHIPNIGGVAIMERATMEQMML
jgi:hypothetical protein